MFVLTTTRDGKLEQLRAFRFRHEATEAFIKARTKLGLFEQNVPIERKRLDGVERIATEMGPTMLMLMQSRDPIAAEA